MDSRLAIKAFTRVLAGFVLMAALLFIPAGTLFFWQAWLLLAILFVPMVAGGVILLWRNPALLRKRLNSREEQDDQKVVVALSSLMFIASFVLAGLAVRLGWPMLPAWTSLCAAVLFLTGYALYAEVIRENEYLSRTIEVQKGQKVIDTGLYGVVRHPMYACTLIMFLSMPLVLGSVASFVVMLAYVPLIGVRIAGEERVLEKGLEGYVAYERRVRWRLVPHVW